MSTAQRCPVEAIAIEATGRFRTRFYARIPSNHTISDVLSPEYFGLHIPTQRFQEGDLIEVEWEDFTRYGVLQIRAVERTLSIITTKERQAICEDDDLGDLPEGWEMKFLGHTSRWGVFMNGDQVEAGLPTPERARNRIFFMASQNSQRAAVKAAVVATEKRKPGPKPKAAESIPKTVKAE